MYNQNIPNAAFVNPSAPTVQQSVLSLSSNNLSSTDKPEVYHLLVSHNNRIQSWINPFLKLPTTKGKPIKVRFSNCAAISLKITQTHVIISLLDEGDEYSNKKPEKSIFSSSTPLPYWGNIPDGEQKIDYNGVESVIIDKPENGKKINYVKIDFEPINLVHSSFFPILDIKYSDYSNLIGKNILIVRHGEALHNDVKIANIKTDTELTARGITQGFELGERLKQKNIILDTTCYVSDLLRTSMTAFSIGKGYTSQEGGTGFEYFSKYVVVPCNHEIKDESGVERVGSFNNSMIQNENKTACTQPTTCDRKFIFYGDSINLKNKLV